MRSVGALLAGGLLLAASAVGAQEPLQIVFGQYYRCSQGQEARADAIVQEVFGPAIERRVASGELTGWLWLTHVQGGAWRRLLTTVGTDMAQMMEAREAIIAELSERNADALAELRSICPGHDDYVWFSVVTSAADPDAVGSASVSSYHMCDRAREARADEIFSEVLAPLYEKHRGLGHLASYGFYAHRVGGVFRRLETVSGADHLTVLNMQGAVYEEAFSTNPLAMREFSEICSTHSDYLWSNAGN